MPMAGASRSWSIVNLSGNVATEGLQGFGGAMISGGGGWGGDWNATDGADGFVQAIGGTISGGAVYFGNMSLVDFSYCRFMDNKAYQKVVSGAWLNRDNPPSEESYVNTLAGAMYIGRGMWWMSGIACSKAILAGRCILRATTISSYGGSAFRENGSAIPVLQARLFPSQQFLYP